jgi:hypothetical protein
MNLYLLRVGADTTEAGGGFHSPIFDDLSYLFIPIPDWDIIPNRALTYGSYQWNGKSVEEYLPVTIRSIPSVKQTIHNDPEFNTFTYGSPMYVKGKKGKQIEKNYRGLSKMDKGDIIAFYAAFRNPKYVNHPMNGYYFFAYMIIQTVISYSNPALLSDADKQLVINNHHYIHNCWDQVIVVGRKTESRVLDKAVLLSSIRDRRGRRGTNYYPNQSASEKLGGYDRSLNFSSLRQPCSANAQAFKDYLDCFGSI